MNFSDSTGHTCEDSYDPGCVGWNQRAPYDPKGPRRDYNGENASKYAMDHKNDGMYCNGADCTAFASKVLSQGGGLKTDGKWKESDCRVRSPWVTTPALFDYLTDDVGPQYKLYTLEIPAYSKFSDSQEFSNFMENFGDADLRGSLIFFNVNDLDKLPWDHVAVIVGKDPNTGKWLIWDHSGPTDTKDLPREIDSSPSHSIIQVAIVLITTK